ncbi:hypothetical protein D3C84_636820 [compost metagenome]
MPQPGSPAPPAFPHAGGVPDFLQGILEHIDRGQRLVGREQFLQLHGLPVLEVFAIAQQQPAALLDHPARRLVLAQAVGLVDPDAVDHLAPVTRHHVEQVVHHFGPWAMLFHFQVESGVHVHRHRLDLLTAFTEQLEERADRLTAVAVADPQHPRALGIHDHRGVAMAFVQGELVHHQAANITRLEGPDGGFQSTFVELFERMPMQTGEAADMADGQQLQQALEPDAQALSQAGGWLQPVDPLGHPPAAQAIDTAHRHLEQHALIQQIPIAYPAQSALMDQRAGLATATAIGDTTGLRLKFD